MTTTFRPLFIQHQDTGPHQFLICVDGGGTQTRLALLEKTTVPSSTTGHTVFYQPRAKVFGKGSGLGLGIENSWIQIHALISQAFAEIQISHFLWENIAIVMGLAGVNHPIWRQQFTQLLPNFAQALLDTDGLTALFGAHNGQAGVVVAAGTGSIAVCMDKTGGIRYAGGWGFGIGDEGSGAWIGLKTIARYQAVLDQRIDANTQSTNLTNQLAQKIGTTREDVLLWGCAATPSEYAQLAKYVFELKDCDATAAQLLHAAARELDSLALALDPSQTLPLVFCGTIGQALIPYSRLKPLFAQRDALTGAQELFLSFLSQR